MPRYYNRTNTCDICKTEKLIPRATTRELDEKGNWTGRWICNKCRCKRYYREITKLDPNSKPNILKSIANSRIGSLDILSTTAKGLLIEATIAKYRGLEILSIKNNNFENKNDLSIDKEYERIESKGASLSYYYYYIWHFEGIGRYNYDNAMLFCMDDNKPWKNIERIYVIGTEHMIGRKNVNIIKFPTRDTWYDDPRMKFRIDEKPYNKTYHDLMSYIGNKRYIGIEDIRKWIKL